jgi:N-acetylglucosaminyl-diphospho-decaprenol L-rhamnosyltransferase
MHDLSIIIVSTNEARWLRPNLTSVCDHAGEVSLDVVVVDNESSDGTAELVATEFPEARTVRCENHGFPHANNRALMTCDARYVLFLNPDTQVLEGTFAELLAALDERPTVGLVGARQLRPDGTLHPTIRRFPSALRALGEALGSERLPLRPRWLGERELDLDAYELEFDCDWTTGSFMLARREALESAGFLDERFFMYSDEPDLCRRIKRAGWEIRHLPLMTIVHHEGKAGVNPAIESLNAYTRLQYARKHFSPLHRAAYLGALLLRYAIRALYPGRDEHAPERRAAARQVVRTLTGAAPVPHGPPPRVAVAIRSDGERPARVA